MNRTWIVVADSVTARIFATAALGAPLLPVSTLTHKEGRLHGRDLVTDGPGSSAGFGGGNHVSYADDGPVDHEHDVFAAEVADFLDDGRRHNRCDAVWLVMSPRLLGRVRGALTKETARLVRGTLERRLVHADEAQLRTSLQELR